MISAEGLQQQIKELLILHNGNVRMADHPLLIKDARDLNIDARQLSHMVNDIYKSINWSAVELIDQKLLEAINNNAGIIKEKDANAILDEVKNDVDLQQATSYMISKLQKLGLQPRDRIPLEWTSFRNPWMTEEAWKKVNETSVYWLDEKVSTLERMGEISFTKIEETKYAIKNTHALPPLVTVLTRSSSAHEQYARIIQEERDLQNRYLRVIYRLNPSLPFRFKGQEYKDITALLSNACSSAQGFRNIIESYRNGHIHIWIEESYPDHKLKLTVDNSLNGFLTFLYKMDPAYPFYINNNKYNSPAELVAEARRTIRPWQDIAIAIDNGNIYTWLRGLGKHNWIADMEASTLSVQSSGLYTPEEFWKASVQTLVNTIEAAAGSPLIESDTTEISLPALEAGVPVQFTIQLKLAGEGFVKAGIRVENEIPAISLSKTHCLFHSQENSISDEVTLTIDPVQLIKDEVYEFRVIIHTIFQEIEIPVSVKAVFPRKAFFFQLAKYAAILAIFFGCVRWMLDQMMSPRLHLPNANYMSGTDISEISLNPLAVIFPFTVLIAGLLCSFRIIKKLERL